MKNEKMKNVARSIAFGTISLVAGVACHRFAPGLGLVLMPMFWPLAALAGLVPVRYSVTTATVVPFVAFLLTGMPAAPLIVAIKSAAFTGGAAVLFRLAFERSR